MTRALELVVLIAVVLAIGYHAIVDGSWVPAAYTLSPVLAGAAFTAIMIALVRP